MDFQKTSGLVAVGHTSEAPSYITSSRMVSCDSNHIGLLLETLHDVAITAIDMENVYLNAPCAERICFVGGTKCKED